MQDLTRPLRGYQGYAVNWALDRIYTRDLMGCALFLDPGLGKTRTSLTIADTLLDMKEARRILIIAPLRPVYSVWPNEITEWKFTIPYTILHDNLKPGMSMGTSLEIINPEGLVKASQYAGRWDVIIVDESNKFKNWSSQRMKHLKKILLKTPKRIILNGTPVANSLGDLHSQMYIIDNGKRLGATAGFFRAEYMTLGGYKGKQWIMKESKAEQLLDLIADVCLRMDAESFLDMPELHFNDIWCDLSPNLQQQYNTLKRELAAQLESGQDIFCSSAGSAYMKCKQFANGSIYHRETEDSPRESHKVHDIKLNAAEDLLDELSGKPLLLAYQLTQDVDRLKARKRFKDCPVIQGSMKSKDVDKIIDEWNQGRHACLLAQTQTISHGLNMQAACNHVGWLGLTDSPDNFDQLNRRVYRQGVKGPRVTIHRILMRGTVDETMLDRVTGKLQTQEEFVKALKAHSRP